MGILLSSFHSGCDEILFFKHCATLRLSVPLSPTLPLAAASTCTILFCTCTDQPLANDSWETPAEVSVNPAAQLPFFFLYLSLHVSIFSNQQDCHGQLGLQFLCLTLKVILRQSTDQKNIRLSFVFLFWMTRDLYYLLPDTLKQLLCGTRGRTQRIRALVVSLEDLGSTASTYMEAYHHPQLVPGDTISSIFLLSWTPDIHVVHKHTRRQSIYIHKLKIKKHYFTLHPGL